MKPLSYLCFFLILASCTSAKPPHVVREDFGGRIVTRFMEIEELKAKDKRVEIRGICASACTLYLGMEDTCVRPQARLGFHGPMSPFLIPLPPAEFEKESAGMAAAYPPALARWFMEEGRHKIGADNLTWFTGAQVIEMGARACPPRHNQNR